MGENENITTASRVALMALGDGEWHFTGNALRSSAWRLYRMGLLERRGESRLDPREKGYEYRITNAGRRLLAYG